MLDEKVVGEIKKGGKLSFHDLMQCSQDVEDMQKDIDMMLEFMDENEVKTFLKKEETQE